MTLMYCFILITFTQLSNTLYMQCTLHYSCVFLSEGTKILMFSLSPYDSITSETEVDFLL